MSVDDEVEKIKKAMMKRSIASQPQDSSLLKPGAVNVLTDSNFEALSETNLPVLVDFWAEWRAPRRMMAIIID